jgi:hypothetical protein
MAALFHFFIVLLIVLCLFASITSVVLGTAIDDFSTWRASFVRLWRLAMGEVENFYDVILAANSTLGLMLVVIFHLLVVLLLFNVLISIMIGAHEAASADVDEFETVVDTLQFYAGRKMMKFTTFVNDIVVFTRQRCFPSPDADANEEESIKPPVFSSRRQMVPLSDAKKMLRASPAPAHTVKRILAQMVFELLKLSWKKGR